MIEKYFLSNKFSDIRRKYERYYRETNGTLMREIVHCLPNQTEVSPNIKDSPLRPVPPESTKANNPIQRRKKKGLAKT